MSTRSFHSFFTYEIKNLKHGPRLAGFVFLFGFFFFLNVCFFLLFF